MIFLMVNMLILELWLTHTLKKYLLTFFLMTTPSRKHLTLCHLIYLPVFVQNIPHITKTLPNDHVNTSGHPGIHFSRIPISHLHSCRCRRQEVIFCPIKVIEAQFPDSSALNSGCHGSRARSAAMLSQLDTLI